MSVVPDAIEATRRLIDLEERKVVLLKEMLRALLLMELIGAKHVREVKGKLSSRAYCMGSSTYRTWKDYTFVVLLDGEQVFEAPLEKVPHEFWPTDVLRQYHNDMQRRLQRKLQR